MMKHEIVRHRHELRRRRLTVDTVERLTPHMLRMIVAGDELEGFVSLSPDDHVKLFVTGTDGEVARRDYTPRHYDEAGRKLTLDFAVHDAGPATRWALAAAPGDMVEIGGPRGSAVIPDDFDWWLLIGDETALPAIGRRIEEMRPGLPVTSVVVVPGPADEQHFDTAADHRAIWVHRAAADADDPSPVTAALNDIELPPGDGFVWIAAEATVARAARTFALEKLGHPLGWLKANGYWIKGKADATEKF